MRTETILNVFPSQDESKRLVIAIEREEFDESRLVLRQESYADDVGWFVQSRIAVEPDQVPGLKMSLTGSAVRKIQPSTREVPRQPTILQFANVG